MMMLMLLLFLCGPSFCSSWSSLSLCTISHDVEHHGLYVDCHGRSLTEIPKHFPINTTSINLSHNHINSVMNYSFIGTPYLRSLDVSYNAISSIEPRSFWKCHCLKTLKIHGNNICVNGSLFEDLGNLQELGIDDCYDAEVLKPLTGIITIEIAANRECKFTGFHYLSKLKNLRISGFFYCRNDTFKYFNSTKIVSLRIDAVLIHIEINALAPLLHLEDLRYINTNTGLSKVFDSLYGLRNRSLATLVIDNAKSNAGSTDLKEIEGRTLTKERIKYLCQICLSNFSAPNNRILYIDSTYIENSPIAKCLKHFDISRNMITSSTYKIFFSFWELIKLEYLDVSDQAIIPLKNWWVQSQMILSDTSVDRTDVKGLIISVPENLTVFMLRGVSDRLGGATMDVNIRNGQNVKKIDVSFNGLKYLHHINGLENVEFLDLSGNAELLLNVPHDFFCSFKCVETLRLTDLSFSQTIVNSKGKMYLSCLPQLKHLDISDNRLVQLPSDLFKLNPLLEHLDLSRNIFTSIPVHLSILPNLHLLDVSSNSIGSLDKQTTDDIDKHNEQTRNSLAFDLKGNYFECSCGNFDFLFWLSETEVLSEEENELLCITEDGNTTNTKKLTGNIWKFWRECIGRETFSLSVILLTLLMCCIFVALLIDTNHTKLAYFLIYALKYQIPRRKRKDFQKDVYLSYADADYRWACHELGAILEERNLNLFIWDRDSVPGDCTAEVITETVNQCWKTILYFTENYERDAWSYLTTMAAINCVDNLNPDRLILLLPENENPRVPECLLQVVPESCIFYVPQELNTDDAFWDELERAIKKET